MERIYLSPPHMGGEEKKFVDQAFETNWIAPAGPNIDWFEKELADYYQMNDAVALSSGTAAIHLALKLLGVGEGDEVICSAFTFAGSCFPIVYEKCIPVFIDSELQTWNMSPDYLEHAIEDGIKREKKPKAIILVHLYGTPAKLNEIISIAQKYQIPIIEDAAEGLGASYNGKKLGAFGEFGILSFNGNKIITTSGGGALLSSKLTYLKRAKYLSTQAKADRPYYHHEDIGYNYRMSNITAGIGRGQLQVLDKRVHARREIFKRYINGFATYKNISFPIEEQQMLANRWLSVFNFNRGSEWRDNIINKLEKNNIECRALWKPMQLQPVFRDCKYYGKNESAFLFENGLCLPSGSSLSIDDQNRIIELIVESL